MARTANWLVLVAWVVIGAAAAPVMAQCCRCDNSNGSFSSCNPGFPDQASCESLCPTENHSMFGQFQTCPAGMVFNGCSEPSCDVICVQPTPAAATAPTLTPFGLLVAAFVLVGTGAFTLRRRMRGR